MRNLVLVFAAVLAACTAASQDPYAPGGSLSPDRSGPSGSDATGSTPGAGDPDGSGPVTSADGGPADDGGAKPPNDAAQVQDGRPAADAAEYNTPTVCSSNTYWTGGDSKSKDMHPGLPCRKCHVAGGSASGKSFDVSGTVYLTAHEPDDCNGNGGASVVITDGNGKDHTLAVTGVGNFYNSDLFGLAPIPKPLQVKVVYNGKERAMVGAVTDGNCNVCHTETGTQLAPGRIMLP